MSARSTDKLLSACLSELTRLSSVLVDTPILGPALRVWVEDPLPVAVRSVAAEHCDIKLCPESKVGIVGKVSVANALDANRKKIPIFITRKVGDIDDKSPPE